MSEKKKILVVDDEETITRAVQLYLEATERFEVRTVNDPRRAVDTAVTFRPDLVILDIVMPQLGGDEVAAKLRDHPVTGDTPVVFLTALVNEVELRQQGDTIGGHPFMAKPVEPADLVAVLDRMLEA